MMITVHLRRGQATYLAIGEAKRDALTEAPGFASTGYDATKTRIFFGRTYRRSPIFGFSVS